MFGGHIGNNLFSVENSKGRKRFLCEVFQFRMRSGIPHRFCGLQMSFELLQSIVVHQPAGFTER